MTELTKRFLVDFGKLIFIDLQGHTQEINLPLCWSMPEVITLKFPGRLCFKNKLIRHSKSKYFEDKIIYLGAIVNFIQNHRHTYEA